MPNIAELRKTDPDLEGLDDDQVVDVIHQSYYADMPRDEIAKALGVQLKPAPVKKTGFLRTQADRALALSQGVVGGVKMISDLAGPDNVVSQNLGRSNTAMQGLYSPERQAEMKNRHALIEAADAGDSTMDQITTRLGGIVEAPLQTTLQAAGSMAPNIALAAATGGVSAGPGLVALAARIGMPAALGIGMGVGSIKGQNFEAVFQKAKEAGQSDDEATALAVKASEYSAQNAPQQALGGALGMLDSLTGAERFVSGMVRKKGAVEAAVKAPQGMIKRGVSGGVEEAIPEGLQGAQGQYAQNEALNNSGFPTNPYAGVVGQGINDAVVGSMLGAPLGVAHGRQAPAEAAPPTTIPPVIVPETGAVSRAVNLAGPTPIVEQPIEPAPEPIIDPVLTKIQSLPDDVRGEALAAYNVLNRPDAPKGAKQYNKQLLDKHLDPPDDANQKEPVALDSSASEATETIAESKPDDSPSTFASMQDAQDFISQQRRSASIKLPAALPVEFEDNTFGIAVDGSPSYAEATRQANARELLASGVQEGDLLNAENKPFTRRQPADKLAKETGGELIELASSTKEKRRYVVRPQAQGKTDVSPASAVPATDSGRDQPRRADTGDSVDNAVGVGSGTAGAVDTGRTESGATAEPARLDAAGQGALNEQNPPASPTAIEQASPAAEAAPVENPATARVDAVAESATGKLARSADVQAAGVEQKEPVALDFSASEATETVAPEMVKIKTLEGINTYVRKEDLAGDAPLIRQFTSMGKSNGRIHRENLDPSGDKQAARNTGNADNPFFDVITTKSGSAFATKLAARREMLRRGLGATHGVASADRLQPGTTGFVIQKNKPKEPPAQTGIAQTAIETIAEPESAELLELKSQMQALKALRACLVAA